MTQWEQQHLPPKLSDLSSPWGPQRKETKDRWKQSQASALVCTMAHLCPNTHLENRLKNNTEYLKQSDKSIKDPTDRVWDVSATTIMLD